MEPSTTEIIGTAFVFAFGFLAGWAASFVLIFRRPKLERMNENARLQIEHERLKRELLVAQGRHEEVES